MDPAVQQSGWWLASDGNWYPPSARPQNVAFPLIRQPDAAAFGRGGAGRSRLDAGGRRDVNHSIHVLLIVVAALTIAAVLLPIIGQTRAGIDPATLLPINLASVLEPAPIQAAKIPPPPAPASGNLVTPAIEHAVIDSTWAAFSSAFADGNVPMLEATTTPATLAVLLGWSDCGCRAWPATDSGVSYSAPAQSSYPLSFFAEIQGTYAGGRLEREVVFTQADRTAPWLIAYLGAYEHAPAALGSPPQNLQSDPVVTAFGYRQNPEAFAQLFQTVDQTGAVPTLPAGFEDEGLLKQALTRSESVVADDRKFRESENVAHSVVQTSQVFASPYGDIQCFTMEAGFVITSSVGAALVQPRDRHQWGRMLAPGSYQAVEAQSINAVCLLNQINGGVVTLTNMGGQVTLHGIA